MKCVQKYCKLTLLSLVLAMSLNPEQVAANNNTPRAIINLSGNSTTVSPGIPITFDGTQSYDPDNTNIIAYNWWYVDGVVKSQGSTADKKIFSFTFTLPAGVNSKTFQIKLTVRDNEYITASKTITVTVTLSGRTEYYLTDHLGSIRTTIDQNGTVIGFDDYDPFGNVLPGRSYNAGTPNDLNKFTGHERDQEGGLDLDYMLARNYDSELGRFYSVDPLASKFPAWSPYNYTMNNPLRFVDPTGMAAEDHEKYSSNSFVQSLINTIFQPEEGAEQQHTLAGGVSSLNGGAKELANGAIDVAIQGAEVLSKITTVAEPVLLGAALCVPEFAPALIGAAEISNKVSAVSEIVGGTIEKGKATLNGNDPDKAGNNKLITGFTSLTLGKAIGKQVESMSNQTVKNAVNTKGALYKSTSSGRFVSNFKGSFAKNVGPAMASYGSSGIIVATLKSVFE